MILSHLNPDCTGHWTRVASTFWRCDSCMTVAAHCIETMDAIATENAMDDRLHTLEQDGRRLLDQDRMR